MDTLHTTDDTSAVSFSVSKPYSILRNRSEFLTAARASKQGTKGMMVQGRFRDDADPSMRVGFTCSKKVGNSVARNRAKRRLRAIAHTVIPDVGHAGWDYVLIGRADMTATRDFGDLQNDLKYAIGKIHEARK